MEDNHIKRLSKHGHSTRMADELLFHVEIYMPGNILDKCNEIYQQNRGKFKLVQKGIEKIGCDEGHSYSLENLEKIANSIDNINELIFEVSTQFDSSLDFPFIINKFVARLPYDSNNDISIVFSVKNSPKILTAWVNPKNDTHHTLNKALYVQNKKDRQERVKAIQNLNNHSNIVNKIVNETMKRIKKELK